MFIPLISSVIVLLIILSYLATSGTVTNYSNVKMAHEKISYTYEIEKIIVDAVENLCQKNPVFCKDRESGGIIELTINDISGYLPNEFENTNLNEGTYSNIYIKKNYTTIELHHNIEEQQARYIYLNHYKGKMYGIAPKCLTGSETATPTCNNGNVYHSYATSLNLRGALE